MAVAELKRLNADMVQAWLELEKKELELLTDKAVLPVELYCYGRPPLLSTRAALAVKDRMTDARGNSFRIRKNGILTQVFSEQVMSIPPLRHADALFYDLRHAETDETDTARFNFDFTLS